MIRIRNADWKDDESLQGELKKLVQQNYSRKEILVIVKKNHVQYAWSLKTLGNRLKYFNIKYIDNNIGIDQVYDAVRKEIEGPGSKLGYRALTQKIREIHSLRVTREAVYTVMQDVDPEGLERRGGVGTTKKKKRDKQFISPVSYY